jgi:beta-lactam-binding protein with PASTA domain
VLRVMRANGLFIVSVAASLLIVGVGVYVLAKHIRSPRKSAMQQVAETEAEAEKTEGEMSES